MMTINTSATVLVSLALGFLPATQAKDEQAEADVVDAEPIVVLRALDKVTARITEISVPIGQTKSFGTLKLAPRYCRTRPPIEPPETFAYLTIRDEPIDREPRVVFEGWMIASSPALNPLEHPVYDIWVLACKTSSGDSFVGDDDQLPDF